MLLSAFICQYLKEYHDSKDFNEAKQDLEKILIAKGHNAFKPDQASFNKIVSDVDRMFSLEFNPSSSVIGAVMSQEIIKVITKRDHPNHGLFIYDSANQTMTIEKPI